jgi:hypothetical protein
MNFLGIKQVSAINFVLKIISQITFSILLIVWTAFTINWKFRGFCVKRPKTQNPTVVDCGLILINQGTLMQNEATEAISDDLNHPIKQERPRLQSSPHEPLRSDSRPI